MEIRLRTTRTLKVTEQELTAEQRELLAQLYDDPRYQALLDAMELACIAAETAHLNTSVGQPEEILGGHALTKATWLFFTYVQKLVSNAYHTRHRDEAEPARLTFNDMIQGVEYPNEDE